MEYRVRRRSAVPRRPHTDEPAVSDAIVRRFLLRAGFRLSSDRAVEHTRQHLGDFLEKVVHTMRVLLDHDRRARFRLADVVTACQMHGIRLYGYDDVCRLESAVGWETYHVTEMVESCTAFGGPEQWDDEPDVEPGVRFSKTDFVANYLAFAEAQDEAASDDDDSEWSWYGESDAESDSGDECEEEEDTVDDSENSACGSDDEDVEMGFVGAIDNNKTHVAPERQLLEQPSKFIQSLRAAQDMVDTHLLRSSDEKDDEMDEDSPIGQGYSSDCDDGDAAMAAKLAAKVQTEDELWKSSNNLRVVDESKAEQSLEAMASVDENEYVMPRHAFAAFFRSVMVRYEANISTVALSALHNASEQYLHRALTEGVLSYQLKEIVREDEAAVEIDLQVQLQQEREKVTAQEQTIADLKTALKAKETEMQRQIAQLQRQLAAHLDKENLSPNDPTLDKPKTLGKRKSSANKKQWKP
ncbi:hypothetical protein PybrP1_001983 [[Pythium] brassicae (nom. inval.)]|nr:hypothetical protein PybrP1_001983 [[Pythium] brassicae (nom. inval.)]